MLILVLFFYSYSIQAYEACQKMVSKIITGKHSGSTIAIPTSPPPHHITPHHITPTSPHHITPRSHTSPTTTTPHHTTITYFPRHHHHHQHHHHTTPPPHHTTPPSHTSPTTANTTATTTIISSFITYVCDTRLRSSRDSTDTLAHNTDGQQCTALSYSAAWKEENSNRSQLVGSLLQSCWGNKKILM